MAFRPDVVGVVLAGGLSSRMGTDKALLPLGGVPLLSYTAHALSCVFSEVIISCGTQKRFAFLGLDEVTDVFENSGPLGGIHASLLAAGGKPVFIVACDMPFTTPDLISHILPSERPRRTRVASYVGRIQPLLGLYVPDIRPHLEHRLRSGAFSVIGALESYEYDTVSVEPLHPAHHRAFLRRINTVSDYDSVFEGALRNPTI